VVEVVEPRIPVIMAAMAVSVEAVVEVVRILVVQEGGAR
jgi:hypothetical protein